MSLLDRILPTADPGIPRAGRGPVGTRRRASDLPVRARFRVPRDGEALEDLLGRVFPASRMGPAPLSRVELFRRPLEAFPEGQWVAERADGRLVGVSVCLRVDLATALAPHSRARILEGEAPWGNALYGVGLAVDPDHRGQGVGRLLVQVQVGIGRLMGCHTFLWGARMAGLQAHRDLGPAAYLARVRSGAQWDPALGPMLAMGFQVLGLLEGYAPDPDSLGYGVLLHRSL